MGIASLHPFYELQEKDPIKLVGAPIGCAMTIQRATDGTAAAQKLGEQNFLDNMTRNYRFYN